MAENTPPRTIFLTGFPGFIATRLVERLAANCEQFYLLVQPPFIEKAKMEVESIALRTDVPIEKFAIIPGNITLAGLGIDPEDTAELVETVTEVHHLAAIYDLAVAREPAFSVNVEGTKNVNGFVRTLKRLSGYNYVSTCYVAGKRIGRILETELEHTAGFRNFYEETKYLAELEVEKLKRDLPVTVFRPSVVVGDSRTGETAKYDGIYYLIRYLARAPRVLRLVNVGNKHVKLNLVPVDHVVEAITSLSRDPDSIGKTFAIADPSPLTTSLLFDVITEALCGKRSIVSPLASLVYAFLRSPPSPSLTGLPHSAVPDFFIEQEYDTALASGFLARHGITCPSFADYVPNIVDFVKKHPDL
ncbi:SDR family oxidoreductase [Leptolyngbya sp. 7M]|uniref:SDR family oxidoreductase n=1 Tax=Leptolyngbya sp. 7M TaxID=2812896 RepID=UPI001B8AC9F1|nr:SDR family oxidoreductase [Leptolyngbya sp. 7M]QYO66317.1 SDR family oxidoreductase [Leptolyngbya sp. 7M]